MNRKKEISNDIWDIMRQVYNINVLSSKSEKQQEFLDKVVDYIEANLGVRRKRQDKDRYENAVEFIDASEERKQELIKEEADAIAGKPKGARKRK